MVRQVSFFHVDIKILPFSDSPEDICLDVYLILLMVEHVKSLKTQTWHIVQSVRSENYENRDKTRKNTKLGTNVV